MLTPKRREFSSEFGVAVDADGTAFLAFRPGLAVCCCGCGNGWLCWPPISKVCADIAAASATITNTRFRNMASGAEITVTELLFIISAGLNVLFRLRAGPNSQPPAGADGFFRAAALQTSAWMQAESLTVS